MNSHRVIALAFGIAICLVISAAAAFMLMFGIAPATSLDRWGQFGDFFGGLLNPLFGMLAFLAVLWSIGLQERELRQASAHLSSQAEVARQELQQIRDDRNAQDLLHVIKDIDTRLEAILRTEVSTQGTIPRVTIAHMVSEAERYAISDGEFGSYHSFIEQALIPGSMIEAPIRELIYLVERMRQFLEQYSALKPGAYAPVIIYYADKVFHMLHLLEHLGKTQDDTRVFFATIGDPHS